MIDVVAALTAVRILHRHQEGRVLSRISAFEDRVVELCTVLDILHVDEYPKVRFAMTPAISPWVIKEAMLVQP